MRISAGFASLRVFSIALTWGRNLIGKVRTSQDSLVQHV